MTRKHSLTLDYVLLALASVEEGDMEGALDSMQDAIESPDYDETVEELDASNDDAFEEECEEETSEFEDDDEYEEDEYEEETLASVLASIDDEEDEFLEDPYGENVETSRVRGSRRETASPYRERARDNLRRLRRS